jgi:ElaB/YqjD/DUF883 family membrane-anchored ribosome-binding protein
MARLVFRLTTAPSYLLIEPELLMSHSTLANRNQRKHTKRVPSAELNGSSGPHVSEANVLRSVRQLGTDVTRSMKAHARDLGETATGYLKQSRKKARSLEQSLERQIEQRPIPAVLTAAGIGLLVGIFCARRR